MSSDPLLRGTSLENDEKICYGSNLESLDSGVQEYSIYFITGNPGLISYYQPFLSCLYSSLAKTSATDSTRFHICGHSFKGMELTRNETFGKPPEPPLSLAEQIEWQERLLYEHIESRRVNGKAPKVILMGHSVGSYILLELIRHHRDRIINEKEDFDLIGGILLFPTITHIAQSPLGIVASVSHKCRLL